MIFTFSVEIVLHFLFYPKINTDNPLISILTRIMSHEKVISPPGETLAHPYLQLLLLWWLMTLADETDQRLAQSETYRAQQEQKLPIWLSGKEKNSASTSF